MKISLLQLTDERGERTVVLRQGEGARRIRGVRSTYELAQRALRERSTLVAQASALGLGEEIDLALAAAQGRIGLPIEHPDPAHLYLTGTGLTHLGSAEGRDKMHKSVSSPADTETDSMRMFRLGVQGGKPPAGSVGVQPEWFYKGDGSSLVASGQPLCSPHFALDAGEEPEIVGIYLIDGEGRPCRLGFALANEFSDHVTERGNYLWLAHSKLRPAALGPELLTGELPRDVQGTSRILRGGAVLWQKPFLSGEDNMSHSVTNLEAHHFKYALFRRPGDVHVHFFGTATLSFSDGVRVQAGDIFEIEAGAFGLPLRNPLAMTPATPVHVHTL